MSQTIPIHYGLQKCLYKQIPGANTFIDDAAKFAGPQQLAEYIEKLTKTSNCISLF